MKDNINVFLQSDNNYAPFVSTTMASILKNTDSFISFYVLDCGISNDNISKIKNIKKYFKNFSISFIKIDMKLFSKYKELPNISRSMYARYLIPEMVENIDKAIYSDVDVIFTNDIKILWDEKLGNYIIGAVPSPRNCDNFKNKLRLNKNHIFFRSGLLLIDCKKWRMNNITKKLFENTEKFNNILTLPDQEILNKVFDNNYKKLDQKYCVIYKLFKENGLKNIFNEKEIKNLINKQVIIHYPGANEFKPWNNKNLDSAKYFWDVIKYTDFSKEIKEINKNFMKKKHKNKLLFKFLSIFIFNKKKRHKFRKKYIK